MPGKIRERANTIGSKRIQFPPISPHVKKVIVGVLDEGPELPRNNQSPQPSGVVHIRATIDSKPVRIVIDSGSSISLINDRLFNNLPKINSSTKSDKVSRIVAANGSEISTAGIYQVPIKIVNKIFFHPVILTHGFSCDALLGNDFLSCHGATIDYRRMELRISDITIKIELDHAQTHYFLALQEDTTLQPMTETILLLDVIFPSSNEMQSAVALVEPTEKLRYHEFLRIARAIVNCSYRQIPVRIANFSEKAIKLFEGMKVATLEPIPDFDGKSTHVVNMLNKDITISQEDFIKQFNLHDSKRPPSELKRLKELLWKYYDVFAHNPKNPGRTKIAKHHIHTGDAHPLHQSPYRVSPAENEIIQKEVQQMLENKQIRPSSSPWSSPVVLVKKKDGSIRFCIDYRKLNSVTHRDTYPLPRVDETLDLLGNAQIFSKIDLASGYWQIEVDEKDREKTAFITRDGIYEWEVMPFGLTNAPATFQRTMDILLSGIKGIFCLVYIDDIIIFSKTFDEHLQQLEEVFKRLRKAGLQAKASKCSFIQNELIYLGHRVSFNGIEPDPSKIKVVRDFPVPASVRKVREFLGLCNYYRRFIRNFADLASPLTDLTKKDAKFDWTAECQACFDELKKRLTSEPILAHPDFRLPFTMHSDASNTGLGIVLTQVQDGKERVISYASRALTKAEKNYSTTEREALAVVWGSKYFRPYLYGRRYVVYTDHNALVSLMKSKDTSSRLTRWALTLEEYNPEIKHRPGKKNMNADALSRIYEEDNKDSVKEAIFLIDNISSLRFKSLQQSDPELRPLYSLLQTGKTIPGSDYILHNGYIMRQWTNKGSHVRNRTYQQYIVPAALRNEIMTACHDD
jgi:hypothetical protein